MARRVGIIDRVRQARMGEIKVKVQDWEVGMDRGRWEEIGLAMEGVKMGLTIIDREVGSRSSRRDRVAVRVVVGIETDCPRCLDTTRMALHLDSPRLLRRGPWIGEMTDSLLCDRVNMMVRWKDREGTRSVRHHPPTWTMPRMVGP